jgi:hypothetical protein
VRQRARQGQGLAFTRMQEAELVLDAWRAAQERLLAGPAPRARVRHCQDQVRAAERHRDAATTTWQELA